MDFTEELDFLHDLDLQVDIFGKDLKRFFDGGKDCKIFVVVTNQDGDELYYPETLPEPDMSKLRNWIRCGDPKGFGPEWKSAKISNCDAKIYLAGQDLGVDCTSVMDDMFVEEGGETYTYTYTYGREGIRKVSHPHESLSLSEHYDKAWRDAEDFSDILVLNQKFLLGEIPVTPYHGGKIDDETIPLVESLLRIHDFQLLTDNSQPYEHQRRSKFDDEWAEYEQRPYVSFTMPGLHGRSLEFFASLKHRPEIMVHACKLDPFMALPGSDDEVTVTRERIAKTAESLSRTEWVGLTWALRNVDISGNDYYCLDALRRADPVVFMVAAREWGVCLDLLGIIEEVAIECDLPRVSRNIRKQKANIKH